MRVLAALWSFIVSYNAVSAHERRLPNQIAITPHVLSLTATTYTHPQSPSSAYLHKRRYALAPFSNTTRRNAAYDPLGTSQQELITLGGRVYMTNVTVDNSTYTVVIDTGSSDTWLASSSFTCISRHNRSRLPQAACGFGTLYDPEKSPTYREEAKNVFEVGYTDGEFLTGDLGEEDVAIGGLSVRQTLGMVDRGWWIGDGRSSGLIGLAYSALASGVGVRKEGGEPLNYTSIVFTIFETYPSLPQVFSLALSRPPVANPTVGGLLAIGGIPDIPHVDNWAITPIIPRVRGSFQFYSILVDGFIVTSQASVTKPANTREQRRPRNMLRQVPWGNSSFILLDNGLSASEGEPGVSPRLQPLIERQIGPVPGSGFQPVKNHGIQILAAPGLRPRPGHRVSSIAGPALQPTSSPKPLPSTPASSPKPLPSTPSSSTRSLPSTPTLNLKPLRSTPSSSIKPLHSTPSSFESLRSTPSSSLRPISSTATSSPESLPSTRIPTSTPKFTPVVDPSAQPTPDASTTNKLQMLVDCGATNMFLPTDMADYLASLFSPPATFSSEGNVYSVPCDAVAPKFAVVIEGIPFYVDAQDLVPGAAAAAAVKRDRMEAGNVEDIDEDGATSSRCNLSMQRSQNGDSVLGDTWLKGVVAVFDVGDNKMMFAAREKY